jgi:hypothetical protein
MTFSNANDFVDFCCQIRNNIPFTDEQLIPHIKFLKSDKKLMKDLVDKKLISENLEAYILIG